MLPKSICAAFVALFLSFAPASAQRAISTPLLASDGNFRDVAGISAGYGGTGFADTTSNNGVMRTGVFYRSEALTTLTGADQTTLSTLHIGLDVDLRTPSEIAGPISIIAPNAGSDWLPPGAAYINVNIYGTPAPPSTSLVASPAAAVDYFTSSYRGFVTDPVQRTAFQTALLAMANEDEAALFHCSAGKDRTGWTAMLLQSIAGVSQTTIMNDYLASNSYMAAFITQFLAGIPAGLGPTYAVMLGVQSDFLQAGLDQVSASYGSLNAYLTQGLGLSQADIYVLRARMVEYLTLPGQNGSAGNAAAGAAFLNALQNSPLAGRYTAYNYYLQSAVDAGTLAGVETQAGGQIHADAASYLLRQPGRLDAALTPYTSGREPGEGRRRIWLTGFRGHFGSDARAGSAGSTERSAGSLIGVTYRVGERTGAHLAIGYDSGSVESAGASADIRTVMAVAGGRYGFSTLESGPYAAARAAVGWVDYQSVRPLGGDLGTARGRNNGAVYSGRAELGDVIRLVPVTITPQAGFRVSRLTLGSFNESGSELALGVNGIKQTSSSLLAGLDVSLDPKTLAAWTITPCATVGYELALGDPHAESAGSLYGFTVRQHSAYNSRYLVTAGLGVMARRDSFTVKAEGNAVSGDGEKSTGSSAQLTIGYRF